MKRGLTLVGPPTPELVAMPRGATVVPLRRGPVEHGGPGDIAASDPPLTFVGFSEEELVDLLGDVLGRRPHRRGRSRDRSHMLEHKIRLAMYGGFLDGAA